MEETYDESTDNVDTYDKDIKKQLAFYEVESLLFWLVPRRILKECFGSFLKFTFGFNVTS